MPILINCQEHSYLRRPDNANRLQGFQGVFPSANRNRLLPISTSIVQKSDKPDFGGATYLTQPRFTSPRRGEVGSRLRDPGEGKPHAH